MKKILNKKIEDKKAITLIALVITIVVLIILATVAINLTIGNNGIFQRAKTAKEQYQNAEGQEQLEVAKTVNNIEQIVSSDRQTESVSYYDGTYCTVEKIGRICILSTKDLEYTFSNTWNNYELEVLPEGYRPLHKKTIYGGGGSAYTYEDMAISINTDGKLIIGTGRNTHVLIPVVQLIYISSN